MQPAYFAEKRYSYHVFSWQKPVAADYQAADPQTLLELQMQAIFIASYVHLQNEEFYLALQGFRQLQNLILTTFHPKLPADAYLSPAFVMPVDLELVDFFISKVAAKLTTDPIKQYVLPPVPGPDDDFLPSVVQEQLAPFETSGLTQSAGRAGLKRDLARGVGLAKEGNWGGALELFTAAFQQSADSPPDVRASLLHDMAILSEKAGADRNVVFDLASQSASLFGEIGQSAAQVHALQTLSGALVRGGDVGRAQEVLKRAESVFQKSNLFPVALGGAPIVLDMTMHTGNGQTTQPHGVIVAPKLANGDQAVEADVAGLAATATATADLTTVATSAQLILDGYWQPVAETRSFTLAGTKNTMKLAGDAVGSLKN